jgi:hypothetical protein
MLTQVIGEADSQYQAKNLATPRVLDSVAEMLLAFADADAPTLFGRNHVEAAYHS